MRALIQLHLELTKIKNSLFVSKIFIAMVFYNAMIFLTWNLIKIFRQNLLRDIQNKLLKILTYTTILLLCTDFDFRILPFKISAGKYICVATNLSEEEITVKW